MSTNQESKRPTMRHIASLVGVSAMTVSRALRNDPRITPALRAEIHRVAEEIGYKADPEIVKLMGYLRRRSKPTVRAAIAAITSLRLEIEPPFLRRARENAQARAAELGYALEVFRVAAPNEPDKKLQRTLLNRGIDGVLLLQLHEPMGVERLLEWEKFCTVIATPSVLAPEFPRVSANHFGNAQQLCEELRRQGCRRIGFVGPTSFCIRTRYAFASAAVWQGTLADGAVITPFIYAQELGMQNSALIAWFKRESPDVIVVHAEEAVEFIANILGLSIRGPVRFACTNIEPLAPKCPGIDERHDLIGRTAVDVLSSLLYRNEKNLRVSHTSTLIEGCWLEPG